MFAHMVIHLHVSVTYKFGHGQGSHILNKAEFFLDDVLLLVSTNLVGNNQIRNKLSLNI